jgi:predicted MPP superfamily phosphohydrolase
MNKKNNPDAMKNKEERRKLHELTKDVEQKTRKLTSGTAFYNDIIALRGDPVWDIQQKWNEEKQNKEKQKKSAAKILFWSKKTKCDKIRKRPRETWSVENISTLLAYKRQKNDLIIKKNKANRLLMLEEWD